jgi:predicted GIY-YIG superfamily endonuclease
MVNIITYPRKHYIPKPSKKWLKNDEGCTSFYVYVLKLDSGEYYVGQTRDLKVRVFEHQEGLTISTAGGNPKLRYFEILPTRSAAQIREHEIKLLASRNRRELIKMISEFQELVSKVDKN